MTWRETESHKASREGKEAAERNIIRCPWCGSMRVVSNKKWTTTNYVCRNCWHKWEVQE